MDRAKESPDLDVGHVSVAFSSSCLPLTVQLIWDCRELIGLPKTPAEWCFSDRALLWVDPYYRRYIEKHYRHEGPPLIEVLKQDQLEKLDKELLVRARDRLRELLPSRTAT